MTIKDDFSNHETTQNVCAMFENLFPRQGTAD